MWKCDAYHIRFRKSSEAYCLSQRCGGLSTLIRQHRNESDHEGKGKRAIEVPQPIGDSFHQYQSLTTTTHTLSGDVLNTPGERDDPRAFTTRRGEAFRFELPCLRNSRTMLSPRRELVGDCRERDAPVESSPYNMSATVRPLPTSGRPDPDADDGIDLEDPSTCDCKVYKKYLGQ